MVHILPVQASKGTARCRVPLGVNNGITSIVSFVRKSEREIFMPGAGLPCGEHRFEMMPPTSFAWIRKKKGWFLHSPELKWSADRWDSKSASKLGFRVCTRLRRSEPKKSQADCERIIRCWLNAHWRVKYVVDQPACKRESQAPGLHPSRGDSQV